MTLRMRLRRHFIPGNDNPEPIHVPHATERLRPGHFSVHHITFAQKAAEHEPVGTSNITFTYVFNILILMAF